MSSDLTNFNRVVSAALHKENLREAANLVNEFSGIKKKLETDDPAKCYPPLQNYLHVLLNHGHMVEAAQLLWTPTQFTPEPKSTQQVWELFDTASMGLIMGAASMSKSFGMGVRLFLEWIRDPKWTTVKVIGPSEDHLEANLFSHLVGLHKSAKLPMPGEVGELFIGLDRRDQLSSIKGTIIPVGRVKKASRLQGNKRKPRSEPHPIFGALSRMFIFIDEIENVPGGLWSDVDNVLSQVQEEGASGFKIFGAYNPTNQTDEVGKRAEPPFGWEHFDVDKHYRWKSTRGWDVLRLDGEKSENVVQNKIVFDGLQTRTGLSTIAKNAGGTNSPGYFSMGRGAYPPSGVEMTVIPSGMLPKWRGEFIWLGEPSPVGACDLALEGRAAASFTKGRWGRATGYRLPPSPEFPDGQVIMFKDSSGNVTPQWGLQVDNQFALAKGDTVVMKDQIMTLCRRAGIRPEYFACDRTGNGAGIADLLKNEWSAAIHDVNYSSSSSDKKIMAEDTMTCYEQYLLMCSELWFAMRSFGEFGYMRIGAGVDMSKLTGQMTQRKFRMSGSKTKVEAKSDYISRGHESPDEADSLSLLVHAVRMGSGQTFSMRGGSAGEAPDEEDDHWYDGQGQSRIDETNRTDTLEIM